MAGAFSTLIYIFIIISVISTIKNRRKKLPPNSSAGQGRPESGSMPHRHETAKYHNSSSGSMPHRHESRKYHNKESGAMDYDRNKARYRSMADASNLPKGYILLNGEPVRVADLEGK